MHAIKEARKYIERKPEHPNAQILARLVLSLEAENDFSVNQLCSGVDMAKTSWVAGNRSRKARRGKGARL